MRAAVNTTEAYRKDQNTADNDNNKYDNDNYNPHGARIGISL